MSPSSRSCTRKNEAPATAPFAMPPQTLFALGSLLNRSARSKNPHSFQPYGEYAGMALARDALHLKDLSRLLGSEQGCESVSANGLSQVQNLPRRTAGNGRRGQLRGGAERGGRHLRGVEDVCRSKWPCGCGSK